MKNLWTPWARLVADDPLDVGRAAVAGLSSLDVDDRAEAAEEGAAPARVEAGTHPRHAADLGDRQVGHRLLLEVGKVLHEVVERLEAPLVRIDEQRVETTLELAGIERDAALHRLHEIGGQRRQHRDAAAGMKAADHDRHPALTELHREVDRAGELVALHADQQHHAAFAGPRERRDDAFGPDPGVRLVVRRDGDLHVRSEHAALGAVRRESVHRRHRVRRDGGAHPLDHVAVVVVVRRLDQDDAKRRGSGLLRQTSSDPAGFSKNVASGRFRRTAKGLPYQPSDAAAISNDGAVDERRRTDGAMTPGCSRTGRPATAVSGPLRTVIART